MKPNCNSRKGFLMSLEAAFALTLLLIAGSALPAFSQPKNAAPDFFLCSDAALALVKSDAFSDGSLQARLDSMHALSGMCFSSGAAVSSGCAIAAQAGGEKLSFSVPSYQGGALRKLAVYCWREN